MGSLQTPIGMRSSSLLDLSCGYLLRELQMIWDEVGEDKFEREKVLLDIEQECVEAYRRKVDHANISRSRLHQELAESEAELTHLLLRLGEGSVPKDKKGRTLREQLDSIAPALHEMRLRKDERVKQFRSVKEEIQKVSAEVAGKSTYANITIDENDLSLKKLDEYQNELQSLHDDKNERLQKVDIYICAIRDLSATLGAEASMIITKIHPSLNDLYGISKNISDDILKKLNDTVVSLEEEKHKRLEKLHHLGRALLNMWNLMDASFEDRQMFSNIVDLLSYEPSDVCAPGSITLGILEKAEAEVMRLDQLKASKTKEIFLKKQKELEDTCNISHMETPSTEMENITNLVHSGEVDHVDLLTAMDEKIARAKEEAASRKGIIEKVERWMLARDEERWLEEYDQVTLLSLLLFNGIVCSLTLMSSQDENRYSVSRNAHRNLRRAERARIMVGKITGLVESVLVKTKSWEAERQKIFLYNEVPLVTMLQEYNSLRQEKEAEKQRLREMKKILPKPVPVTDNIYMARPSTSNSEFGSGGPLNQKFSRGLNKTTNYTSLRMEHRKTKTPVNRLSIAS